MSVCSYTFTYYDESAINNANEIYRNSYWVFVIIKVT